jgi:hypothetical protein
MTSETLSSGENLNSGESTRQGLNTDAIGDGIAGLERLLRPNEGWIAAALMVLDLVVVVMSAEQADWVATPNLILLLFLAMVTGLALYRIPVWSIALLPVGLAMGLGVILWQISSFSIDGTSVGGTKEVLERLNLWLDAARTGSINIDDLPFSFALMVSTWLTGFLGSWLFLRYGNFWGVFVLGGIGLLSNLTFLPPNTAFHLGVYLFTALLLVARVQAIRRKQEWERRSEKGRRSPGRSIDLRQFRLDRPGHLGGIHAAGRAQMGHSQPGLRVDARPLGINGRRLYPAVRRTAGPPAYGVPHLGQRDGAAGEHLPRHDTGVVG